MKFFIAIIILWSVSTYGIFSQSARNSVRESFTKSFPVVARTGFFFLKYPVMSWEQLQFRRDAISKAIAELRNTTSDKDIRALLYSIGVVA